MSVKISELSVLALMLLGLFMLILGIGLYAHKIMQAFSLDLELQLAFFGFLIAILALIISKIISKVIMHGRI